jgi:tryptophan-rich sensory protein
MASIGLFVQIPVSWGFSYISDHFDKRGETVMAGLGCHMLGYIFNRIFTEVDNRSVRFFGVVWTQTFGTFSHPLNIAWMSLACTDSEERALAMAMVIMGANIAGIYGAQIFRSEDSPRYRRAFAIGISVLAVALVTAAVRWVDDVWFNGRKSLDNGELVEARDSEEIEGSDENSDEKKKSSDDEKRASPIEVAPKTIG